MHLTSFAVAVGLYALLDSFAALVYLAVQVVPLADSSILNLPAYAEGFPVPCNRVALNVTEVGVSVPDSAFTTNEGLQRRLYE